MTSLRCLHLISSAGQLTLNFIQLKKELSRKLIIRNCGQAASELPGTLIHSHLIPQAGFLALITGMKSQAITISAQLLKVKEITSTARFTQTWRITLPVL